MPQPLILGIETSCDDTACAMIAHAALLRPRRGSTGDPLAAEAESRIPL